MDYLRNTEKIISQDGYSPEGVCGCCTVMKQQGSQILYFGHETVEGKEVVTTEGLSAEKRETVVNAFRKRSSADFVLREF